MGKVKIKKSDVWIDMTPMSDVMVLLLTFFMLTSTFVKQEPVKVNTPGSVSEIKVPEKNVINILVNNDGKVFMGYDNVSELETVLGDMTSQFGLTLNATQVKHFKEGAMWGVPMEDLQSFLNMDANKANAELGKYGLPLDSVAGKTGEEAMSEFQLWVKALHDTNPDAKIAIKADEKTPYKVVKKLMSELQDMNENRYYLITQLKKQEEQ